MLDFLGALGTEQHRHGVYLLFGIAGIVAVIAVVTWVWNGMPV